MELEGNLCFDVCQILLELVNEILRCRLCNVIKLYTLGLENCLCVF
jgi:hypothetical protein